MDLGCLNVLLFTYANFGLDLVTLCAAFRTHSPDELGLSTHFSLSIDSDLRLELTEETNQEVESILANSFHTNDDIIFEVFLQAVDRVFSISLDAEPRRDEKRPGARYSTIHFQISTGYPS